MSQVLALLGSTNTGKTHRALERMLEHDTGVFGLPLRLLAREVYDRACARVGEDRVALLTGEEKRIPSRASYWICTTEAMPTELEVDFVAVDEVQLAGTPQRGHVFTERLLHARGARETYLLGSDTMESVVSALVPTAKLRRHPRLSQLKYAGPSSVGRLPPRSAVVAFSLPQVYELAEKLRAVHGGAAVVSGALSPRTGNAQVELFQAGQVDYLVATDAIGMGLNLDVRHVAFAGLRKFDGRELRALEDAELGQLAGRAGRYVQDGTFGVLQPLEMPEASVVAVERQRFASVRKVYWRNPELCFDSVEALLDSLRVAPSHPCLRPVASPEDSAALAALASFPEVRARATGREAVELLWQVCTVPDFRKLLFEVHVELLRELYLALSGPPGRLTDEWMRARVEPLASVDGEVELLVARMAAIRTWTYAAHQPGWLADAARWQERSRAVEDALSDALHARLVLRFVDGSARGRKVLARPRPKREPATERDRMTESLTSRPFARLEGKAARASAGANPGPEGHRRWQRLADAESELLSLHPTGEVHFEGGPVAKVSAGARWLEPEVRLAGDGELHAALRTAAERRVRRWVEQHARSLLGPLGAAEERVRPGSLLGVLRALEAGFGAAHRAPIAALLEALSEQERGLLAARGVVVGERFLWVAQLMTPAERERRWRWCHLGAREAPREPLWSSPSFDAPRELREPVLLAVGMPVVAGRAVRVELLERVASASSAGPLAARWAANVWGSPLPKARAMLRALGLEVEPERP